VARARAASSNTSVESFRSGTLRDTVPRVSSSRHEGGRAWPADARGLASRHHFTAGHGSGRRTIPLDVVVHRRRSAAL